MMNGNYIKLRNDKNDTKTFFLFPDGDARELKNDGWGEIIDFFSLYKKLEEIGYIEIDI